MNVSREARILFSVFSVALASYVWVNFFAQFGFQAPFATPASQSQSAPVAQTPPPEATPATATPATATPADPDIATPATPATPAQATPAQATPATPATTPATATPIATPPADTPLQADTPAVSPVAPVTDAPATVPVTVARDVEVITVPILPVEITGELAERAGEDIDLFSPNADADTIARLLEGIEGETINPFAAFAEVSVSQEGSGVSPNSRIVVSFSEPMLEATTVEAFQTDPPVNCDFELLNGGTTLACDPTSPLAENQTYVVTIAETATDAEGNPLGSPQQFSFTTGSTSDVEPPSVVGREVLDEEGFFSLVESQRAAVDVSPDSSIAVRFSEAMSSATTTAAFQASPPINCDFDFVDEGQTLLCNPTGQLAENTTYTVTIAASATDVEGNPLGSPQEFSFNTTAAGDVEPPTFVAGEFLGEDEVLALAEAEAVNQPTLNGAPVVGVPPITNLGQVTDPSTIPPDSLPTPPTPTPVTPPAPDPQVSQLPLALPSETLPSTPDVLRRSVRQASPGTIPGRVAVRVPSAAPARSVTPQSPLSTPLPTTSLPRRSVPVPAPSVPSRIPAPAPAPIVQAPVPEPRTFSPPAGDSVDIGLPGEVSGGRLATFVQSNGIAFTGAVRGPVSVGVFRSNQGSFSVVLGRTLPNSNVVLTDITATEAILSQDGETFALPLSP